MCKNKRKITTGKYLKKVKKEQGKHLMQFF